jgi:hypothetical protein
VRGIAGCGPLSLVIAAYGSVIRSRLSPPSLSLSLPNPIHLLPRCGSSGGALMETAAAAEHLGRLQGRTGDREGRGISSH